MPCSTRASASAPGAADRTADPLDAAEIAPLLAETRALQRARSDTAGAGEAMQVPGLVMVGGRPYQIVAVPVRAPRLIGWVLMGQPRPALLDRMGEITKAAGGAGARSSGASQVIASTIDAPLPAAPLQDVRCDPAAAAWRGLQACDFRIRLASARADAPADNQTLHVVLAARSRRHCCPFP